MDTFFALLKKSLVVSIFVMFAFVATYIPQNWNQVQLAHAGGATGGSTEPTQIMNNIQLGFVNIAATASAALDKITSWATNNLYIKEYILDGIAWAIAKAFVSSMVSSLVDWINSGFQGRPMFVQDFMGFLREAADQAVGEYIQQLGSIGSFLCDPFKLDIQIAISLQYQRSRVNQPAPTCTLTGVIANFEDFTSGALGSFNQGGWRGWFDITSAPSVNTPYGSLLAAQTGAEVRILNAKGKEATQLNWGSGILSSQVCQMVHGADTTTEQCFITTPGKAIQEALSFNLDSGRQSLITADEFNEIIAALLGQLANTALQGTAGLLGLSGGTGYTTGGYSGGSYTSQVVTDSSNTISNTAPSEAELRSEMQAALAIQQELRSLAETYRPRLVAYINDPLNGATNIARAERALVELDRIINKTTTDIATLQSLLAGEFTTDTATRFYGLVLYQQSDIYSSQDTWDRILSS
jgi:hypothetical protein